MRGPTLLTNALAYGLALRRETPAAHTAGVAVSTRWLSVGAQDFHELAWTIR
jgi:hypothetical protein